MGGCCESPGPKDAGWLHNCKVSPEFMLLQLFACEGIRSQEPTIICRLTVG